MRRIIMCSYFIAISLFSHTQNLTFSELTSLCGRKSWESVDQYLTNKKWQFHNSEKGDDEHYSIITWSFQKDLYEDKAVAWLKLYVDENVPAKISIELFNLKAFESLKSGLRAAGMTSIGSEIEEGMLVNKYSNSSYYATIFTSKIEREEYEYGVSTSYSIIVIKKGGIYDNNNGIKRIDLDNDEWLEVTLKDGKVNGPLKAYYSNGTLKLTKFVVNNLAEGYSKEYDESGNLNRELTYKKGVPNGPYKIYENGDLKESGSYLNGSKYGLVRSYEEGKLSFEVTLKNDTENGFYTQYYYDDDTLVGKEVGSYIDGLKSGTWTFYSIINKKSKVISFENYRNGVLHGLFKGIHGDSIIVANYWEGQLNGSYKLYRALSNAYEIHGDTSKAFLVEMGTYKLGKKHGFWRFTPFLDNYEEGYYLNDLRSGQWKTFFGLLPFKGDTVSRKGKLHKVGYYKEGLKSGQWIQYGFITTKEFDCSDNNDDDRKICLDRYINDVTIIENYKDDVLHGMWQMADNRSKLILIKGEYDEGKELGKWNTEHLEDGELVRGQGEFVENLYSGRWIYSKGRLNPYIEADYSNGQVDSLKEYSLLLKSSPVFLISVEDNPFGLGQYYKFVAKNQESAIEAFCWIDFNASSAISFKEEFLKMLKEDSTKAFLHGPFTMFESGNIVQKENYQNGKLHGSSKKYFHDQKVVCVKQFEQGTKIDEYFLNINDDSPFTGTLSMIESGIKTSELTIMNGKQHGPTKIFAKDGTFLRIENYIEGKRQ